MSDQSARVALLQRRLLTCEAARRRAARTGDNQLASDLANINRELIIGARAEDIRSLAIVWLLHLGATADLTATLAPSAPVTVTGTVTALTWRASRHGHEYATFTLDTPTGRVPVVVPPEVYGRHPFLAHLGTGERVQVAGRVHHDPPDLAHLRATNAEPV